MDRKELINLVEKIQFAEGIEEENDKNLDKLEESLLDPSAVDYIFAKEFEELFAREIVDRCLSYKSIKLPASFG